MAVKETKNDFSQGSVPKLIWKLAVPMIVAQVVNALYSIVDRVYIGHMAGVGQLALTGIGLCFPITMTVAAFSALIGYGGAPLSSILRGRKDADGAEQVLGNSVSALCVLGILIPLACFFLRRPVLYLFGASDATFPYADQYITIYLTGSLPVMLTLGLNAFINAQGFTRDGMVTVGIGAVLNLALDPLFIFAFHMGIAGAAVATVISQTVSCLWVLRFLLGKKNLIRLRRKYLRPDWPLLGRICALGVSSFIMQITESAISAVFNANLAKFGGDIYVTTMTVGTSINQIYFMVIQGFGQGAQPVTGYNYGAGRYDRVRQGFRFLAVVCLIYATVFWGLLQLFMPRIIGLFNSDAALLETAVPMLRIYFLLTFLFALQNASQSTFVALGEAKKATFFALFRKVLLLIPLIIVLPRLGFGVTGIFAAEPIADTLSAVICFMTFLLTSYRELKQKELAQQSLQRE